MVKENLGLEKAEITLITILCKNCVGGTLGFSPPGGWVFKVIFGVIDSLRSESQALLGYMKCPSQNINQWLTSKSSLGVYTDMRKPYRVSHFAGTHYGPFVGMMIDHVIRRLVTVGWQYTRWGERFGTFVFLCNTELLLTEAYITFYRHGT